MKTVIIGADFVYDSAEVLRPVEVNTNIGITVNKIEPTNTIFDSTDIKAFIVSNGFTKIIYMGHVYHIKKFLEDISIELSITFEEVHIESKSVSIPYIEDADDTLIIRTSYDSTAVFDETYCKNKINFLNLIKDTEFGSQFAYVDSNGDLISTITTIKDNGIHPNFILKARYPDYNKKVYPKLFKVSTQEELDVVLQNVNADYFLMEFHINENTFSEGSVTKIRKISMIYPPTLQSIHIGAYTDLSLERLTGDITYDVESFELIGESTRYMYITGDLGQITQPKLMDDDYVVLADGTLKSGLDLQIGDIVKTINVPNISDTDIDTDEVINYNIDYNTFEAGVTYSTNAVTDKKRIDAYVKMSTIIFEDGFSWTDSSNSMYLVSNNGITTFKRLDALDAGDIVLLVNTDDATSVSIDEKVVVSTSIVAEKFSGWVITVERTHLFLTKTSSSILNSPSFAAIEHNVEPCYVLCQKGQCCSFYSMTECFTAY